MQLSINIFVLISILVDFKKVISSKFLSGHDLEQHVPAASTSPSFLLFTNNVPTNKHQSSKHKIKSKKKSSNRNRAAVHRTSTTPIYSTTTNTVMNSNENDQLDESLDSKVKFNLPPHVNLTVKVGESVVLNCAINSSYGITPGVIWMQGKVGNVLTLDTGRITADSRFEIIQQPLQMITSSSEPDLNNGSKRQSGASHGGHHHSNSRRLRHHSYRQVTQTDFNYFHLRINNVQIDDENEYACETSTVDEQSSVHALFNLQVTQSPSFIEQLTSETNNALFEFTDTILKCFATGKPVPKIKWYQISEENEILKDLFHESTTLSLKNVSKNDPIRYECVASNGILPSVSKKFSLTVYYSPAVIPLNDNIYQTVGQSVLLGCIVTSNPESTVVWYRKNKTNGTNEFELIDVSQSRYQTHKLKQINQTVHYFKIKHLERVDYTVYKCEVINLVGKNEAVMEILDLQETEQFNSNSNNNNGKTVRKNQSISYVLNNPYLDEVMKSDDSETENYSSQFEEESDEFKSRSKETTSGLRKKLTNIRKNNNNNNNNKTFHKYQINKSNSIQETENSLQRINDILGNGSTLSKSVSHHSILVYFSFVAFNLIYFY